jgi:methylenetetrahydrofolate reductase (NADPH)
MQRRFPDSSSLEVTARQANEMAAVAHRFPVGMEVALACLPGEANAERARAAVALRTLGFEPVPHIAARLLASAEELESTLSQFTSQARVSRVLVIAGDLDQPRGPFDDALAVIRSGQLEKRGIREIGIAGYPQGHAKIDDATLAQALSEKHREVVARGMRCSVTTQFGFDPQAALEWIAGLRAAGLAVPVRLGVAGPARAGTLMKYAAVCGVRTSAKVLAKYGRSITRLLHPGGPDAFIAAVARGLQPAHGEVSLHLYPFGGLQKTADWLDQHAHIAAPAKSARG